MRKYILLLTMVSTVAFTSMTCHSPTAPSSSSDTTSNDWTFTVTRLGDGNSSQLFDVVIINDTLAYAVGAIYMKDSTGQFDLQPYNLATWNGKSWTFEKVPYYYQGQPYYDPFHAVCALNGNDVWLGGNGLIHVQNGTFSEVSEINPIWGPYWIEKIWGTSSSNLYIVGDNGSIAHYNGSTWQKIQSGTSLNFYDVYGAGGQVLAVASNPFSSYESAIVQLNGTNATTISNSPINGALMGVWFVPGQQYYVVGSGVYKKRNLSENNWSTDPVDSSQTFVQGVRGNASNDVFVVGSFGQIWHFNGKRSQSYLSQTAVQNGGYGSIAVKGNLAIAVGQDSPYAVAAIGRRQN